MSAECRALEFDAEVLKPALHPVDAMGGVELTADRPAAGVDQDAELTCRDIAIPANGNLGDLGSSPDRKAAVADEGQVGPLARRDRDPVEGAEGDREAGRLAVLVANLAADGQVSIGSAAADDNGG